MRRKVVEAAHELGYRPNLVARSLITRRSNIVGIAMGHLQNQFYPAVLEALSAAFEAVGYGVLLFIARPGDRSNPIFEEVLRYRVDALVLASINLSSHFDEICCRAGVPIVTLNRRTESATVSSVTADNYDGAQTIATFLMAGRHQRYAFMAGLEDTSTSRDREAGFTSALVAQGFGPPQRVVGHYSFEAASAAARTLFASPTPPDAIFCANDHMALATLNVARVEFGLDVGRAVSIVGFDDAGPTAWPLIDLTTYVQPIEPMVNRVVTIICDQLANFPGEIVRAVVRGELVVRRSARLPVV